MAKRIPLGIAVTNWALAGVFALFAYTHLQSFVEQPRLSVVLIVAMETLLVVFVLIRKDPDKTWHSWKTWSTTLGGTFFPLLLRPVDVPFDLILGQLVQVAGSALQIAALLSLNRSMGLLPAHRGVQSNGLYRLVRHPLYAAYTIAFAGYLVNNWSTYNAAVIILGTALQIMRIRNEERLLFAYPAYIAFANRTRWRMFPFVW
jgi:protein-S-isoprenylcysteine O-methyltransferase Ste14